MKKLLLSLGALSAIVAPVAAVVACSTNDAETSAGNNNEGTAVNTEVTTTDASVITDTAKVVQTVEEKAAAKEAAAKEAAAKEAAAKEAAAKEAAAKEAAAKVAAPKSYAEIQEDYLAQLKAAGASQSDIDQIAGFVEEKQSLPQMKFVFGSALRRAQTAQTTAKEAAAKEAAAKEAAAKEAAAKEAAAKEAAAKEAAAKAAPASVTKVETFDQEKARFLADLKSKNYWNGYYEVSQATDKDTLEQKYNAALASLPAQGSTEALKQECIFKVEMKQLPDPVKQNITGQLSGVNGDMPLEVVRAFINRIFASNPFLGLKA